MGRDAVHRTVFAQLLANGRDRLAILLGDALHFAIHLIVGDADGFALGDFAQNQRRLYFPNSGIMLRLFDLFPIEIERPRIDALLRQRTQPLFDAVLDLSLDKPLRHREIVGIHQLVDELVLRFPLRFSLALGEDRFAQRFLQFIHVAEIAQILREIVVHFRQFLAAQSFDDHLEPDGLAGQFLLSVVLGIDDVEFLFIARRSPAQVLGKSRQRFRPGDQNDNFVGLDRCHPPPKGFRAR